MGPAEKYLKVKDCCPPYLTFFNLKTLFSLGTAIDFRVVSSLMHDYRVACLEMLQLSTAEKLPYATRITDKCSKKLRSGYTKFQEESPEAVLEKREEEERSFLEYLKSEKIAFKSNAF